MKTILVVEPDPAHRLDLAAALEGEDQHVLAIDTLDAARDALDAFRPDLVVSSAELADGSGYEVSRLVHARHGDQVPVMLLWPEGAEPMTTLLAGTCVVPEPIHIGALRARCARLLRPVRWVPLA